MTWGIAMKLKTALAAIGFAICLAAPASATTFRFAFQGDLKSLDPYTLNEVTTLAHLGHVYESDCSLFWNLDRIRFSVVAGWVSGKCDLWQWRRVIPIPGHEDTFLWCAE